MYKEVFVVDGSPKRHSNIVFAVAFCLLPPSGWVPARWEAHLLDSEPTPDGLEYSLLSIISHCPESHELRRGTRWDPQLIIIL
jgi:hypothetical protein